MDAKFCREKLQLTYRPVKWLSHNKSIHPSSLSEGRINLSYSLTVIYCVFCLGMKLVAALIQVAVKVNVELDNTQVKLCRLLLK